MIIADTAWDHAVLMARLTATNVPAPPATSIADSSHGTGGVCSVVTTGIRKLGAIATGRWCRLLLSTRSNSSPPSRARSIISVR